MYIHKNKKCLHFNNDYENNTKNSGIKSLFDLLMEEDTAFHLQNDNHEDSLIDSGEGMDIETKQFIY